MKLSSSFLVTVVAAAAAAALLLSVSFFPIAAVRAFVAPLPPLPFVGGGRRPAMLLESGSNRNTNSGIISARPTASSSFESRLFLAQRVRDSKNNGLLKDAAVVAEKVAAAVDRAASWENVRDNPDAVASAFGGAVVAAAAVTAAAAATAASGGGGGDSSSSSVLAGAQVAAALAGAAAFVAASQDGGVGRTTRAVVGRPTRAAGMLLARAGRNLVDSLVASVLSAPEKLASFVRRRAEAAAERVASWPGRTWAAFVRKAERAADEFRRDVRRLPRTMAEYAAAAMERLADEVKAAPGRAWDAATDAVEFRFLEAKRDVLEALGLDESDIGDGDGFAFRKARPRPPIAPPPEDLLS